MMSKEGIASLCRQDLFLIDTIFKDVLSSIDVTS